MQRKNRHMAGQAESRKLSATRSALNRVSRLGLRRQKPAVCVLSNHPVVLQQLDKAIDKGDFRVFCERLKPFSFRGGNLGLPPALLCVLDALGPKPATAAIVQQILQAYPDAGILLVSERDREEDCFDLLLLRARGLMSYEEASEHLTDALKCIAKGGFWLSPLRLSRFVDSFLGRYFSCKPKAAVSTLSRRENEVLERLFQDLSNKEIANELNISERTVKFHVSNLLQKFHVNGRRQLILSYGPFVSKGLLGGYHTRGTAEMHSFAGNPTERSRFLPASKDEDKILEDMLSNHGSPRPAYSIS